MVIHHGYGTGAQTSIRPGFLFHADIHLQDGRTVAVHTDETWSCRLHPGFDRDAPRLNGRQGPAEIWDLQALNDDWTVAPLDDAQWTAAVPTAGLGIHVNGPWHSSMLVPPHALCRVREAESR